MIVEWKYLLPPKGFIAINICGFIIVKKGNKSRLKERTKRHELIHTRQIFELLIIPFYIWYGVEWLIKRPKYGRTGTYYNVSFEREAFANDNDLQYLKKRRLFSFLKYISI